MRLTTLGSPEMILCCRQAWTTFRLYRRGTPSQEEFDRFVALLARAAEIGALTVLNLLEEETRENRALRAKLTSLERIAKEIGLPQSHTANSKSHGIASGYCSHSPSFHQVLEASKIIDDVERSFFVAF